MKDLYCLLNTRLSPKMIAYMEVVFLSIYPYGNIGI